MAEKDNWIILAIGGLIVAVLGYFALGKTVNIQAGAAKADCGCSG